MLIPFANMAEEAVGMDVAPSVLGSGPRFEVLGLATHKFAEGGRDVHGVHIDAQPRQRQCRLAEAVWPKPAPCSSAQSPACGAGHQRAFDEGTPVVAWAANLPLT